MNDIAENNGFLHVGAAAVVTEHSVICSGADTALRIRGIYLEADDSHIHSI